ncbi:MAG: class I SAM-dependent methyltransferase [Clostridia bacterium]|nr:class I SAM-dependent methyltransferase [Clostridia bacterium]
MNEQYTSLSLFYDAFMQDVDYDAWCDFYEECFRKFSTGAVEKLADMGCGTGNITLPMASRGYKMTALDLSEEMLALAEQKSQQAGADVRFLCSDMRSFNLGFRADAAICSFDCVNYLLKATDVEAAFYRAHENVEKGGLFIFDVATPYKYKNVLGGNSFVFENEDVFMTWENYFNEKSGICDFYLTFFVREGNLWRREEEEQRQRSYSLKTIRKALKNTGFSILCECGDIDFSPLREESERAFFICKAE